MYLPVYDCIIISSMFVSVCHWKNLIKEYYKKKMVDPAVCIASLCIGKMIPIFVFIIHRLDKIGYRGIKGIDNI